MPTHTFAASAKTRRTGVHIQASRMSAHRRSCVVFGRPTALKGARGPYKNRSKRSCLPCLPLPRASQPRNDHTALARLILPPRPLPPSSSLVLSPFCRDATRNVLFSSPASPQQLHIGRSPPSRVPRVRVRRVSEGLIKRRNGPFMTRGS